MVALGPRPALPVSHPITTPSVASLKAVTLCVPVGLSRSSAEAGVLRAIGLWTTGWGLSHGRTTWGPGRDAGHVLTGLPSCPRRSPCPPRPQHPPEPPCCMESKENRDPRAEVPRRWAALQSLESCGPRAAPVRSRAGNRGGRLGPPPLWGLQGMAAGHAPRGHRDTPGDPRLPCRALTWPFCLRPGGFVPEQMEVTHASPLSGSEQTPETALLTDCSAGRKWPQPAPGSLQVQGRAWCDRRPQTLM